MRMLCTCTIFVAIFCTFVYANGVKSDSCDRIQYLAYCELNDYSQSYQCTVNSKNQKGLTISTLTISKLEYGEIVQKFQYATPNAIRQIYPSQGNRIITVWESGSAVSTVVFAAIGDSIKIVFEKGCTNTPELADVDNMGTDELLISEGRFLKSGGKIVQTPSETEIFQWDSKTYVLLKKVPWEKRFCLQQ